MTDDIRFLTWTPQQRRERTVDALTTQLMSLTSRYAVLMIFKRTPVTGATPALWRCSGGQ